MVAFLGRERLESGVEVAGGARWRGSVGVLGKGGVGGGGALPGAPSESVAIHRRPDGPRCAWDWRAALVSSDVLPSSECPSLVHSVRKMIEWKPSGTAKCGMGSSAGAAGAEEGPAGPRRRFNVSALRGSTAESAGTTSWVAPSAVTGAAPSRGVSGGTRVARRGATGAGAQQGPAGGAELGAAPCEEESRGSGTSW